MLFAAGFGTRMGALTTNRPKPLVEVAGRPLIDHALALAQAAGIPRIVANLHYRGGMIRDHLAKTPVLFSDESDKILETGGGLRKALPLLGAGPVYTLNTDAVWTGDNPLETLDKAWKPGAMRALLLLAPLGRTRGHSSKGDFTLHPDGRISRGGDLVYLGAQIVDPSGLCAISDEVFSLNRLWDQLIAEGRAFGTLHPGQWCDVGHPGGILEAEAMLEEAQNV